MKHEVLKHIWQFALEEKPFLVKNLYSVPFKVRFYSVVMADFHCNIFLVFPTSATRNKESFIC